MTISSTTRKAGPFTGNNVTTAFPFTFKVFADTDLVVVHTDLDDVETTLTLTTDYTVSLNADQDTDPGGTVTLPSALLTDYLLTITSDVPTLQAVELTNGGGFYPSVINAALDRLTIFAQELAEEVARAVKVQISSSTDPDALVASVIASEAAAAASAAAAAASAAAAEAAVPSGTLGYTPVNITGDTMTGNLSLPGINVNGTGLITALGSAATKTAGAASGNVPLVGTESATTTVPGLVRKSTPAENTDGTGTGVVAAADLPAAITALSPALPAATASIDGYMTSTYAAKLDGIAAGANVGYPTDAGVNAIGMLVTAKNNVGTGAAVASGGTTSGAALVDDLVPGTLPGTWRNVGASSVADTGVGRFQRIA